MLKTGFVTCVQLGLACMEEIYACGGKLDLAVTLEDDMAAAKSGRVYLDEFCAARAIPLLKTRHINDASVFERVRAAQLDWLFIVGWSQIAEPRIVAAPRAGALGMHPTLLPVGRGRAAIPWAILKELPATGVTLFKLDAGVDTGPIIAQQCVALAQRETATRLYARVMAAHMELIRQCWPHIANGSVTLTPQDESRATLWPGRKPEDGRLEVSMTTAAADRLIRAVTHPYPGAFIDTNGRRLRIWQTGAPAEDLGGGADASSVLRLRFRDGWLDSTDWCEETGP